MVLSQWCPGGVPMVLRWCSVSRWCLGVTLLVRSCLGRVPVVSQWCPGRIPWCPGAVAVCPCSGVPVVSRWLVPQSCPGGVAVASRCAGGWCPSGVRRSPSVVPVVSWSCPVLGPGGVPPSGVPVVSGVPRGGVPVPTAISENLRLWGGWCSAGEVVSGVAVGRCRSVIRSVF